MSTILPSILFVCSVLLLLLTAILVPDLVQRFRTSPQVYASHLRLRRIVSAKNKRELTEEEEQIYEDAKRAGMVGETLVGRNAKGEWIVLCHLTQTAYDMLASNQYLTAAEIDDEIQQYQVR